MRLSEYGINHRAAILVGGDKFGLHKEISSDSVEQVLDQIEQWCDTLDTDYIAWEVRQHGVRHWYIRATFASINWTIKIERWDENNQFEYSREHRCPANQLINKCRILYDEYEMNFITNGGHE